MSSVLVQTHQTKTHQRGFSLLEMLISTVIMLMIMGVGVASYLQFNDRQTLRNAGKEMQTYLRAAQVKARAGERPDTCTRLLGYAVRGAIGGSQVQLIAMCEGPLEVVVNTNQMPAGTTLATTLNMTFGVLHAGVTGAGIIDITANSQTFRIVVNQGGEIQDADIL